MFAVDICMMRGKEAYPKEGKNKKSVATCKREEVLVFEMIRGNRGKETRGAHSPASRRYFVP